MKYSSKLMPKRETLDHSKVRRDFPIGHTVLINGTKWFVVGYAQAQIRDQVALWVSVKHANEDFFNCDPYVLNLNVAGSSEEVEEEQTEEVEGDEQTEEKTEAAQAGSDNVTA